MGRDSAPFFMTSETSVIATFPERLTPNRSWHRPRNYRPDRPLYRITFRYRNLSQTPSSPGRIDLPKDLIRQTQNVLMGACGFSLRGLDTPLRGN
jgi:hypothetical protein